MAAIPSKARPKKSKKTATKKAKKKKAKKVVAKKSSKKAATKKATKRKPSRAKKKKVAKKSTSKKTASPKAGKKKAALKKVSKKKAAPTTKAKKRSRKKVVTPVVASAPEIKFSALSVELTQRSITFTLGILYTDDTLVQRVLSELPNNIQRVGDELYWDILGIRERVKAAVDESLQAEPTPLSVSITGLPHDYYIADKKGQPLSKARVNSLNCCSDNINNSAPSISLRQQLEADFQKELPPEGGTPMLIADAIMLALGAKMRTELSTAARTQLLDTTTRNWWKDYFKSQETKPLLPPKVVESSTVIGRRGKLKLVAGLTDQVAASVSTLGGNESAPWAFLHMADFSTLGVVLDAPPSEELLTSDEISCFVAAEGSWRAELCLPGIKLLNECIDAWCPEGSRAPMQDIIEQAGRAPAHGAIIDPCYKLFATTPNVPQTIFDYCQKSCQREPIGAGLIARAILEGVAIYVAVGLKKLTELTGLEPEHIYLAGAQSGSTELATLIAGATGKTIIKNNADTVALGSFFAQAVALDVLPSLDAAKELATSFYVPIPTEPLARHYWPNRIEELQKIKDATRIIL